MNKYKINYEFNKIGGSTSNQALDFENTLHLVDISGNKLFKTNLLFNKYYIISFFLLNDIIRFIDTNINFDNNQYYCIYYDSITIYSHFDQIFLDKYYIKFTSDLVLVKNIYNAESLELRNFLNSNIFYNIQRAFKNFKIKYNELLLNDMNSTIYILNIDYLNIPNNEYYRFLINKFNYNKTFVLKILKLYSKNIIYDFIQQSWKYPLNEIIKDIILIINKFNNLDNNNLDIFLYLMLIFDSYLIDELFKYKIINTKIFEYDYILNILVNSDQKVDDSLKYLNYIFYLYDEAPNSKDIIIKILSYINKYNKFDPLEEIFYFKKLVYIYDNINDDFKNDPLEEIFYFKKLVYIYDNINDDFKNDENFLLNLLKIYSKFLTIFNSNITNNIEIITRFLNEIPYLYQYLSDTFKNDNDLIKIALLNDPCNLFFIPKDKLNINIYFISLKIATNLTESLEKNKKINKILDYIPIDIKNKLTLEFIKSYTIL